MYVYTYIYNIHTYIIYSSCFLKHDWSATLIWPCSCWVIFFSAKLARSMPSVRWRCQIPCHTDPVPQALWIHGSAMDDGMMDGINPWNPMTSIGTIKIGNRSIGLHINRLTKVFLSNFFWFFLAGWPWFSPCYCGTYDLFDLASGVWTKELFIWCYLLVIRPGVLVQSRCSKSTRGLMIFLRPADFTAGQFTTISWQTLHSARLPL